MNLAMDLGQELPVAAYVWERRSELPSEDGVEGVIWAIRTGMALENWEFGEARRHWRRALRWAEAEGASASRDGVDARRLSRKIDRFREAVELVLFDGRLPPDLAALAARTVSRMSGRALGRALERYWQLRNSERVDG